MSKTAASWLSVVSRSLHWHPLGHPLRTPTGPAEQSAPEPPPTDAEDPSLLGDHLLGDHLLGDRVLGDHVLGDHLLGDHLLGDHLLGDHLPAKRTVEETTSDALNEPPASEPPASEPPAEEDRQVVQPAPREHKIPTRTNNLSTTIYPPKEKENTGYEKDCQLSREYLLDRKLADISLNITVTGKPGEDFPISCDIETDKIPLNQYRIGSQEPLNFTWTASGLCHKPLYFEEVQAERYGHTLGYFNQPFLSTAHFFCTTAVLPYKMGMRPPQECVYPLGRYRAGGYAPQYIPAVPISIRGGLLQAGGVLAAVFILP